MTPVSRLALSVVFAVLCQLNGRATVTTQLATQSDGVQAAIDRIRHSAHSPLPDLEKRVTAGPIGRGLTIENGTSQTLTAYFKGPILRSLAIPGGSSVDIELTVGEYEVAAETQASNVLPFYGQLSFESNTHYWLRFFTRFVSPTPTSDRVSTSTRGSNTAAESELEPGVHSQLPTTYVPLLRKIPFRGAEIIGYSLGSAIVDRASGARLNSQPGYRFVVVEIEYKGPVAFNPLWFDEILLSTEARSHSWIGLPIRSNLVPSQLGPVTFAPFVWNKDDALITFQSADRYMGVIFSIEASQRRLMVRFRDDWVTFEIKGQ